MGGSGNSDPYRPDVSVGTGGNGGRGCMALRFSTTLQQSPDAPAHTSGSVFELVRVATGGATAIAAVDDDGQIVGTVVEELADLLRCTADGFAYVAEVTAITYGIHTVAVRAADPAIATSHVYTAATNASPTTAQVGLNPGPKDLEAEVTVGSNRLGRPGICELRSLLRVGAPFEGIIDAAGTVTRSPR